MSIISRQAKNIPLLLLVVFASQAFAQAQQATHSSAKEAHKSALKAKLKSNPRDATAHYLLALASDSREERRSLLKSAMAIDPSYIAAGLELAELSINDSVPEEAVELLIQTLAAAQIYDREHAFHLVNIANRLISAGRAELANRLLGSTLNATRHESAFERCFMIQGVSAMNSAIDQQVRGEYERVLRYCTRNTHRDDGVRLLHRGRNSDARTELEKQVEINPFINDVYGLLAQLYCQEGDCSRILPVVEKYFSVETDQDQLCQVAEATSLMRFWESMSESAKTMIATCKPSVSK